MDKKILIIIGTIIVLIIGTALYFGFFQKEKKPADIVKQRIESVESKLDSLSAKASELNNFTAKAESVLEEQGEPEKVKACKEVSALLAEISEQSTVLSQRAGQINQDIDAKTLTAKNIKQLQALKWRSIKDNPLAIQKVYRV